MNFNVQNRIKTEKVSCEIIVNGKYRSSRTTSERLCPHFVKYCECLCTTDTQWRHKSKKSEYLGRCGRQNMLRQYLKIWDGKWIFGRAVKAISSLGVRSPCTHRYRYPQCLCSYTYLHMYLRRVSMKRLTPVDFSNTVC